MSVQSKVLKKNHSRKRHTAHGAYLIELLASVMIAGFLTAMLAQSLSEIIKVNTKTDRSLIAAMIAQNVVERVRAIPFDDLNGLSFNESFVQINYPETSYAVGSNSLLAKRPLQLDTTNLQWGDIASGGELPSYHFRGTAKAFLSQPDTDIDAKTILVRVEWVDSSSNSGSTPHVYETGTVVTKHGLTRHKE
jgi:type II secretory pathway pseudopilin PulG